jgi:hypothetical protein
MSALQSYAIDLVTKGIVMPYVPLLRIIHAKMKCRLVPALFENFKWMPMFTIFFGGLSFHLSCAILSHLCSINMQWGATAKEKVDSYFFKEVPKIFKTFKYMYIIILLIIGGMIYLGCFAPRGWEIKGVTAIVPLAVTIGSHALMPFLLNPSLMIMSY